MILIRILLVGKENLFTEGLERLLSKRANQHVTRIDPANMHTLVNEIWRIQPSVVILNTLNWIQPLTLLAQLRAYPTLKLIIVNEYNNDVVIFEHKGSSTLFANSKKPKMQAQLLN